MFGIILTLTIILGCLMIFCIIGYLYDDYNETVTRIQNDYINYKYPHELKCRTLLKYPYTVDIDNGERYMWSMGFFAMKMSDEQKKWCNNNFNSRWMEGWHADESVGVCFITEEDAMAFKLRFIE